MSSSDPADLADALRRVNSRKQAATSFASQVTPAQAANVSGLVSTFPNLGVAAVPLGLNGVTPDSTTARRASQARLVADTQKVTAGKQATGSWMGKWWGQVKDKALKPVVRYSMAGLSAPVEFVRATARESMAGAAEGDLSRAVAPFGLAGLATQAATGNLGNIARQTTVGAGIQAAQKEGKLAAPAQWDDISGDGWFIGPDSKAGKQQADNARTSFLINGHAGTEGRLLATVLTLEPGGTAYNVVSGLTDATATVVGDPLTPLFGGAAAGMRARNVISRGAPKAVDVATRTRAPQTVTQVARGGSGRLPAAEGERTVTLFRGSHEPLDPSRVGEAGARFTTQRDYAEAHGGKTFLYRIEVPESKMPRTEMGDALGTGPLPHTTLTADEAREATLIRHPTGYTPPPSRTFAAADSGLVDGLRQTVLPEKAVRWLDSEQVGRTVKAIADETDFEKLRRATGKKLDNQTLLALQDARDPVQVKDILTRAIENGSVREKMVYKTKRELPPRITGMVPGMRLDLQDMDDAVEQLDRFQRNANLDAATISGNNEALARAGSNGERFDIVRQVLGTVEQVLVRNGFKPAEARRMTRAFGETTEDGRKYFVDAHGDNAHIPGVVIGGTGRPLPSPHLSTELLDRYIPLPNARDIRSGTSKMAVARKLQNNGLYRGGRAAADAVTSDLFKTMTLALRPAWAVRVVGEEQVRMSAAGLDSAFRHPLSYITYLVGQEPGRIGKLATLGRGGRAQTDVLGRSFADEIAGDVTAHQQALNVGSAGWRNRDWVQSRHWQVYQRHEEPFVKAWHDELGQLAAAPEARETARHLGDLDTVKDMFWDGPLRQLRVDMHAANPRNAFDTREAADQFIDTVADRVLTKTGGHPDLIEAVAHNRLRGHTMTTGTEGNKLARRELQKLHDEDVGPQVVKGPVSVSGRDSPGKALADMYDRTAEALFHALGSKPTNYLSRSPVFRQRYYQRMEEIAPLLTRQDRAALARAAKGANMDKAYVQRVTALGDSPAPEGRLTLAEADQHAKETALDQTRELLYSLHEKAQVADSVRILFPFAEAYREVLTRWSKLGLENPLVPYRAGQMLEAGDGTFFHPDPLTNEEMISVPGSEWVTDKLTGVPVQMEMPLQGMNMFGSILPGVGPVVSIPVGKLLPENPRWDFVRQIVTPYGEQDTSGGVLESFEPAYLKKITAAFGHSTRSNDRALASTTRDVMAYLMSTGDYDTSTREGQDELIEAAKDKARAVYLIRGIAQSTLPSSPLTKFSARDKDGRLTALFKLSEDYRKMSNDDYTTATQRFIDKYGADNILAIISKTTGGPQPTDVVNNLARSHPAVARQYPTTIGFFAPGGEIDPGEIDRQVRAGVRQTVGPEKAAVAANIRIAATIYNQAKARVGDQSTAERRAWLRDVKTKLMADYPGYTGGFDTGKDTATVNELLDAAKNPVLGGSRAGQALTIYVQARTQAMAAAKAQGFAWPTSAKDSAPIRDWLAQVADRLTADYPEFGDMYDRVLSREVE